jgi:pimeloyl-ACP methyl ester carboxylesterase
MEKRFVETPKGRIAYLETGDAERPTILFIHGIPTSGYLWRHVIRELGGAFHCLAPDLMGLGDTEVDPKATDFSMPSQVEMLEDFLTALGVPRAHVVAHDQGGAAGQIFAVRDTERLDRLVLTDCVCFDNWPVPTVRQLMRFARIPWLAENAGRVGLIEWVERRTRFSSFRRGVVDPAAFSDEAITEYLRPLRGSNDARKRFRGFLLAGSSRHTMAVVRLLRELRRPTMILWAEGDAYISTDWGKRLYEEIPGAVRFDVVPGAGHFWPEEKPAEFAARIREFLVAPEIEMENRIAKAGEKPLPVVKPERLRCGGQSAGLD